MCGIAGAISSHDVRGIVQRMSGAIAHRGPDDEGFAELAGTHGATRGVFANRRLAILDLSMAGHQPMWSADGRFCLSYNGEIYNFRELRDELSREGVKFESTGDTEVVLEGWMKWGSRVLPKLRGMFVLSLWDRDAERCYLARDAFGIKPLYITEARGTVLFASEIRALLTSELLPRQISPAALRTYVAFGSVAEPLTIIESIQAVPAGCFIAIDCRRDMPNVAEPERFADVFSPRGNDSATGSASPTTHLREALRDSVAHHLLSDVPIALFLSGGLDSSTVVGVASEVSDTKLDTFTITFDESEYSEAEPARAVALKFGTNHHEIPLTGKDLLDSLPGAFAAMDQPSLDGLNTYAVSRAVRENGIKVVLSGLGGDELFGGYPSFRRAAIAARVWPFRGAARALLTGASAVTRDSRLERLCRLFADATPAEGAYRASRTLFDERQTQSLVAGGRRTKRLRATSRDFARFTLLQQVSYYETSGYMRNTLLRDSDVFSMAHGLELRVPFVDREVAKAAMEFPDSEKLSRHMSKPILVRTMHDILPPTLLGRPKQGFTLPFERWMRKELFDEINRVLTSTDVARAGLSPNAVRGAWTDFQNRRTGMTWSRPWALYTLKRWADQNDVVFENAAAPVTPAPISFAGSW
ncbi:MAG: asparagine synthase (glutamine-hydrolyzing) [Gemmatimonadaceae bacterium]